MVTFRRSIITVACILLVAACAESNERPNLVEWVPKWEDAKAALPANVDSGPTKDACNDALVALRETAPDLRLTPEDSIDETVDRWIGVAQESMFGCPGDTGDFTTFEAAYTELGRLASQIDVVVYGR